MSISKKNQAANARTVYITAMLTLDIEQQSTEIRQMLIDLLDITEQTPLEDSINEALLAFEACQRHHGS